MASQARRTVDSSPVGNQLAPPAQTARATIIRVATEAFARRGYDGTSVREIAELAGIAKGNLTYYFAVKDDLLFEIVERLHTRFLELSASWPDPVARPKAALREALHDHVALVCAQVEASRVSYESFRYLSAPRRAAIVGLRDRYESDLQRLVTAARRYDDSRSAADTRIVLGMLNWPYHWYTPDGESDPHEVASRITDMTLRALRI